MTNSLSQLFISPFSKFAKKPGAGDQVYKLNQIIHCYNERGAVYCSRNNELKNPLTRSARFHGKPTFSFNPALVSAMTRSQLLKQIFGLAGWLLFSFSAAAVGGVASADAGAFYAELVRPRWAPPGWVFGPVWSVLYATIGVSGWLVWRERGFREAPAAFGLFTAQLAANALWTWLFFAWRQGGSALADIIVLWVLILGTIFAFRRIRPAAALLLVPYLAWVSYAGLLNLALWRLNPSLL